jgi:hypothetical protein
MWEDYDVPSGTLRESFYASEGQEYLRDDHYGHKFKYPSEFQGDTVPMANGKEEVVNGEKSEVKTNGVPIKSEQVIVNEKVVPHNLYNYCSSFSSIALTSAQRLDESQLLDTW